MNLSEARAAMEVIDWLTSLRLFEVDPDCEVDDASLVDAVDVLARRAYRALGAGSNPAEVARRLQHVLDVANDDPLAAPPADLDDVPPNAGSTS